MSHLPNGELPPCRCVERVDVYQATLSRSISRSIRMMVFGAIKAAATLMCRHSRQGLAEIDLAFWEVLSGPILNSYSVEIYVRHQNDKARPPGGFRDRRLSPRSNSQ